MNDAIFKLLTSVYGESTARALQPRLQTLLAQHRATAPTSPPRTSLPVSERDALLITYGDQVQAPGAPPLRTLSEFANAHLGDTLSGIHILPFYPYSSDDGFSVIDYLAIDPALGSWENVARLGGKFDLMFDAVFNHISAQSEWFQRFLRDDPQYRDFFVVVEGEPDLSAVVRPRALPLLTAFPTAAGEKKVWTTFSADQIDLNAHNPEVLLALLDALLVYVGKGAKFIRLDAIAYLWKEVGTACIHLPQTHQIIQLMRAVLDEVAPDVLLITETNVPHPDNIAYFGDGTNEAQLVYNFALPPLVLHTLLTGNATALSQWAHTLQPPSRQVTFFNFLASHDGIGVNPARGILSSAEIDAVVARVQAHGGLVSYKFNPDGSKSPYELNITYFDAVSDPGNTAEPITTQIDRFLVSQAIMLALAGLPGIYFHSLFGSRNDQAAAAASGIPRRINRQKFTRAELEAELARPDSLRARVFAGYRKLLAVRKTHAAFHPLGRQQILQGDERVFAVLRGAPDEAQSVLCLHNVVNEPIVLRLEDPALAGKGTWTNLFTGAAYPAADQGTLTVELQPYEVLWAKG